MDISTRGHLELLSPWASRLNRYRPTKVNSVEIDGGKQAPTGYGETGEALRSQSEAVHKTTLQNQVSPGTLGALMEPRKHFLTIKGPPSPPSLSSPAEESGRSTLLPSRPSLCLFPHPCLHGDRAWIHLYISHPVCFTAHQEHDLACSWQSVLVVRLLRAMTHCSSYFSGSSCSR